MNGEVAPFTPTELVGLTAPALPSTVSQRPRSAAHFRSRHAWNLILLRHLPYRRPVRRWLLARTGWPLGRSHDRPSRALAFVVVRGPRRVRRTAL